MPKGGKRAGAGRPLGSLQKRHKVIVEDPTALMPVEWMLAVLRDPEAEQSRRDQMAIQSAPYLHPRLNATSVTSTHGNADRGGDINIVQIFAVPRGARVDLKTGTATIDGAAAELSPITPYAATPDFPALSPPEVEQPAPLEPIAAQPIVEVVDDGKVTRLDSFKNKRDESPGTA
jgi:hypothetical protein